MDYQLVPLVPSSQAEAIPQEQKLQDFQAIDSHKTKKVHQINRLDKVVNATNTSVTIPVLLIHLEGQSYESLSKSYHQPFPKGTSYTKAKINNTKTNMFLYLWGSLCPVIMFRNFIKYYFSSLICHCHQQHNTVHTNSDATIHDREDVFEKKKRRYNSVA